MFREPLTLPMFEYNSEDEKQEAIGIEVEFKNAPIIEVDFYIIGSVMPYRDIKTGRIYGYLPSGIVNMSFDKLRKVVREHNRKYNAGNKESSSTE